MLVSVAVMAFAAFTLLGCLYAEPIGRRLGVIDRPDGIRKHHGRPTPLVGGLALMPPLSAFALLQAASHPGEASIFLALAAAGLGFMLLGLLDDRGGLAPVLRLVVGVVACALLITFEPKLVVRSIDLDLADLALTLGLFAIPFTLLCLVGFMNAVNMVDGKNGLLLCLALYLTICLLLYAPAHLAPYLALLLAGLAVLLPFNWRGRFFMGDSGSYALGAVIGLSTIYVFNQAGGALPEATVVLWLLVPVVDCLRLMASRVLAGRSPMTPDANHLHHRLSRLWPWPQALLVYLAVAAAPGLLGALQPELTWMLIVLALVFYFGLMWATRPRAKTRSAFEAAAGTGSRK